MYADLVANTKHVSLLEVRGGAIPLPERIYIGLAALSIAERGARWHP